MVSASGGWEDGGGQGIYLWVVVGGWDMGSEEIRMREKKSGERVLILGFAG